MIYFITNQKQIYDDEIRPAKIEDCLNYFKDHEEIAVDLETEGFDPFTKHILSLQIGDEDNQFVIDTRCIDILYFKELLEDKVNIGQNYKFDLRFLYNSSIVPKKVYDTYLAEKNLTNGYNNIQRGLDKLAYRYCKADMSKEVRGVIHKEGLTKRVIKYGAKDVEFLHEIKRKQLSKSEEWNLDNTLKLDNEFVRVLAYIEYCGIKVDVPLLKTKIEQDKKRLYEAKQKLDDYVVNYIPEFTTINTQYDLFNPKATEPHCSINWSSSHQVIPLFKHLGIDTQVKDKDGIKDSVDSKVIKPQSDKSNIIPIYLNYKDIEKTVNNYGENILELINPVTHRIHTSFTQIKDTGRLSSGGNGGDNKGSSLNLQNIPAPPEEREEGVIYTRDVFIPEDNNTFIICDYSGQESVVFAEKSRDSNLLDFYDNGLADMHSFVASKLYSELEGLELKEIKSKYKEKRQKAKAAGFALQYGGNGTTIANNLSLPIEEGINVYNAYFEAFPGVKNYFDKIEKKSYEQGYIEMNPVTNRKFFLDFIEQLYRTEKEFSKEFWAKYRKEKEKNSELFINELKPKVKDYFIKKGILQRKSYNYPIQATSADMTKLAGIYLFQYLEKNKLLYKIFIPNVIHDEYIVECPNNYVELMKDKVKYYMEKAGDKFCKRVKIEADPEESNKWIKA